MFSRQTLLPRHSTSSTARRTLIKKKKKKYSHHRRATCPCGHEAKSSGSPSAREEFALGVILLPLAFGKLQNGKVSAAVKPSLSSFLLNMTTAKAGRPRAAGEASCRGCASRRGRWPLRIDRRCVCRKKKKEKAAYACCVRVCVPCRVYTYLILLHAPLLKDLNHDLVLVGRAELVLEHRLGHALEDALGAAAVSIDGCVSSLILSSFLVISYDKQNKRGPKKKKKKRTYTRVVNTLKDDTTWVSGTDLSASHFW